MFPSEPLVSHIGAASDRFLSDLFEFIENNWSIVCDQIKYSPSLFDLEKESLYEKERYLLSENIVKDKTKILSKKDISKYFDSSVKSSIVAKCSSELNLTEKYDDKTIEAKYRKYSKGKLLSFISNENEMKPFKEVCNSPGHLWQKIVKLCYYQKYSEISLKETFNIFSENDFYNYIGSVNESFKIDLIDVEVLKPIFIYFYENLLESKIFQKCYCEGQDIKKRYRTMVIKEIYCSTCGLFRFTSSGEVDIDHYLPKSKFPYLSIYSKNLLGMCKACNQNAKKEDILFPIVHPRNIGIHGNIDISYKLRKDEEGNNIIFSTDKNQNEYLEGINNFIKLFKLKSRYNDDSVLEIIQEDIVEEIRRISILPVNDEEFKRTAKFILNELRIPNYKKNCWKTKILYSFFYMASEGFGTFDDFKTLVNENNR